jgi:hypothetical protein
MTSKLEQRRAENAALGAGTHEIAVDDFGNEYLHRLAQPSFDWPADLAELLAAIDDAKPLQLGHDGTGAVLIDPERWVAIVGTRNALAKP